MISEKNDPAEILFSRRGEAPPPKLEAIPPKVETPPRSAATHTEGDPNIGEAFIDYCIAARYHGKNDPRSHLTSTE
jgi:hypothetical protein